MGDLREREKENIILEPLPTNRLLAGTRLALDAHTSFVVASEETHAQSERAQLTKSALVARDIQRGSRGARSLAKSTRSYREGQI